LLVRVTGILLTQVLKAAQLQLLQEVVGEMGVVVEQAEQVAQEVEEMVLEEQEEQAEQQEHFLWVEL
jgi:hypothetical protein